MVCNFRLELEFTIARLALGLALEWERLKLGLGPMPHKVDLRLLQPLRQVCSLIILTNAYKTG